MSKFIPNQYAVCSVTYENLKKLGYKIEDLRSEGIGKVLVKERQGKRYYSVGAINYENGDIFPSNEFLAGLISQANALIS